MTSPTPPAHPHPDAGRIFYGWRLVAVVALIGLLIGSGLTGPLAQELLYRAPHYLAQRWQWGIITAASGALSLPILLLAGWTVDRYGPRRMAQIGLPLAGVGLLLMAAPDWSGIMLFSGAAVVDLGSQFGYTLAAFAVLNNWFRRRKATAMAIPLCAASGLWQWPLRPLLSWLIGTFGWTLTATGLGLIALFAVIPLSRQIRNHPEAYGRHPDGDTAATVAAGELTPDYTWREAVKSRPFWRLLLAGACVSAAADAAYQMLFALPGIGRIAVDDVDLLYTVLLVISAISILPGGLIGDRIPVRYALIGFGLAPAAGVLALTTNSVAGTVAYFILAGVGDGGRVAPALAIYGVYFGRRNYATLLAIALTVNRLAAAVGATAIGALADAGGGGVVMAVAAILALTAIGAGLYLQAGPPERILAPE